MASVSSRNELEDRYRERVRQEYANYQKALEAAGQAVEEWKKGFLPSPDGSQAYRNALAAERVALRAYRMAIEEFSRLVIDGQPPEE